MTTHARVVIVGGGILGCSLAYHLIREGWSDCVLLEKGELTSGSTWHAAGQVTHSTSSYGLGRMAGYAIELYKRIEAQTGQSVTFHECGSLRIAYSEDELDWLRYTVSIGAALGHPMEILDPAAIREFHPFYNLEGVRAALWTPEDGHVDPAGGAFALAAGARQGGAAIVRRNRVTGIRREANGEWRVATERGDYVCEHVVNAAGTYARQVGQWTGLDLPITCMTHHYLVTDTVPEFVGLDRELPVVRDDAKVSGYVRMEQKSGLIGIYEKANANTVWLDGTPWDADSELGHVLNAKGTIEAETAVVRVEDDRFYFDLAAFFEVRILDWLIRHRRPDEHVRVENVSTALGAVALQGPRSRDVLSRVTQAPLDNASFPWLTTRRIVIADAEVRALRLSYAGELGWELHVPAKDLPAVFDALWSAGEEHGIAHNGSFAMNAMRMEKMFKGASELTNKVTLPEADVLRFVRIDKPGGFVGAEATRRSAECPDRPWQCVYLGVNAADADCLGGEAILVDGERTGAVSSGAWGPSVDASLAFGYVRPEHAAPGTELDVVVLGEPRAARVVAEARYDPGNLRPRA